MTDQTTPTAQTSSKTFALTVDAPAVGTIIIAEQTDGPDGFFGFASPTASLNVSVATSGGAGQAGAVTLARGTYTVSAKDMSADGFHLDGIACDDSDSSGDLGTATATVVLAAGEAVTCTFHSSNTRDKAVQTITSLLTTTNTIIQNNQADTAQEGIDQLNGGTGIGGNFQ